jgi:hypothetical protein
MHVITRNACFVYSETCATGIRTRPRRVRVHISVRLRPCPFALHEDVCDFMALSDRHRDFYSSGLNMVLFDFFCSSPRVFDAVSGSDREG